MTVTDRVFLFLERCECSFIAERQVVFGYVNKEISGLHDEGKVARYILVTKAAITLPMLTLKSTQRLTQLLSLSSDCYLFRFAFLTKNVS